MQKREFCNPTDVTDGADQSTGRQSTPPDQEIHHNPVNRQAKDHRRCSRWAFYNAPKPAHHLATLVAELAARNMSWPRNEGVRPDGEDWPDAYKYTPMRPEESRACTVVWWHPERGTPVFQRNHRLLFGLPNAVTPFNRWARFS